MKQCILLCMISPIILFTSCKTKSTDTGTRPLTAQEYNDKVIDLEESMSEPLLKTEAELKARSDKDDFAGMAQSAKAMEDTVDLRINALKKMDAVGKGGEDFKTVAVRYFEYLKSIYTGYRNIAEAKTDEAKKEASEKMTNILSAQPGVMENLRNTQNKYAADNGFVISEQ
ncbi:MAG: hypothetical protein QM640_10900 [Niabella sp.]